jgi:hypothetical protein
MTNCLLSLTFHVPLERSNDLSLNVFFKFLISSISILAVMLATLPVEKSVLNGRTECRIDCGKGTYKLPFTHAPDYPIS